MAELNKLNIMFIPVSATGHVNSAIGMAEVLKDAGHRITFVVTEEWKALIEKNGFETIIFKLEMSSNRGESAPLFLATLLKEKGVFGPGTTTLRKAINMTKWYEISDQIREYMDNLLSNIVNQVSPDVIIMDQTRTIPSIEKCGIPWVLVCSCNPLWIIDDERTPPAGSGYPAIGDENERKHFRDELNASRHQIWTKINDYVIERGAQPLPLGSFINYSKYLNVYSFPKEVDYTDIRPLPPNWVQFDNFKRSESYVSQNVQIPEQLKNKSGKLIYFSLGSMGGADVSLMERLIKILSKSQHRFIVVKGPIGDRYSLTSNMWGQNSVPQIQVLPLVDLVITHGGNNTVTESFYFGKPMIVMPLFGDQFDNAQRVDEKGFCIRLDPYSCTEQQLLDSIEILLNNNELNEKLSKISKRIQTDNSITKLPEIIEDLVKTSV